MSVIASPATATAALDIKKIEHKYVLDVRTLEPHKAKEVEEWSWRKMKNEKWIVFLDCKTRKVRMWKVSEHR